MSGCKSAKRSLLDYFSPKGNGVSRKSDSSTAEETTPVSVVNIIDSSDDSSSKSTPVSIKNGKTKRLKIRSRNDVNDTGTAEKGDSSDADEKRSNKGRDTVQWSDSEEEEKIFEATTTTALIVVEEIAEEQPTVRRSLRLRLPQKKTPVYESSSEEEMKERSSSATPQIIDINDDDEEESSLKRKRKCLPMKKSTGQHKAVVVSDEEDSTTPTRNLRWKLRSSVKRCSNYEEDSSSDDSDFESSSFDSKKSSKKARTSSGSSGKRTPGRQGGFRSIASYFGGKSPQSKQEREREQKKRRIDPETRAFLDSGVPEVVIRAQKVVEKKKEEDEYLSSVGFFPKITRVGDDLVKSTLECLPSTLKRYTRSESDQEDIKVEKDSLFSINLLTLETNITSAAIRDELCCPIVEVSLSKLTTPEVTKGVPWIEKYKVDSLKDLVVDKTALSKLTKWLKRWKSDIKDDGGASRKMIEKKRRRKDSDSEFVTSDEEEDEFKKKSVLLVGASGCGKTAAVYVTAKHYGFHVVEVNFSSRRSGKEVLQRVEEAVLSHRLESTSNCLLLFKDIELVDAEEDEGFYAAVGQLIATAVRPIVMTTGQSLHSALDYKIDKKDPLRIFFESPKSSHLVNKVILPMILQDSNEEEDFKQKDELKSMLMSMVTHARGDIRQSINQAQFLFGSQTCSVTNATVHKHSIQQEGVVDLGFMRPACNNTSGFEDADEETLLNLTVKGRKKQELKDLDKISESLSHLTDLDLVDGLKCLQRTDPAQEKDVRPSEIRRLKSSYFDPNFFSALELNYPGSNFKSKQGLDVIQALTIDSDKDFSKERKISQLTSEMGEYFDFLSGEEGWESTSCLRTIVKINTLDSVGRLAKRNGRMTSYFNRLDKCFVDRICDTFGFQEQLEMAKEIVRGSSNGY